MGLLRLDIYSVRNILKQSIHPAKTFNFFYGENGSGKSAIVEAIFLLGRAKSFRTNFIKHVITFDQPELIVSSQISLEGFEPFHLGIRMNNSEVVIHRNQSATLKRSDLVSTLPIQIIHPKSFELLESGAQVRREFLDWGVFNSEKDFLPTWKCFKKILAHRNALLKSGDFKQIHIWDNELENYGNKVHVFREQYIEMLEPLLLETISFFFPLDDIKIELVAGWDLEKGLRESLSEDLDKDIRHGFTHSGPHRTDFRLLVRNRLAKEVLSRGQLKLIVICLKLAQVKLLYNQKAQLGCILIDDFSAELDFENRKKLLFFLMQIHCQTFITTTEKDDFGDLSIINDYKLFHVKQGEINLEIVPRGTCNKHMKEV